jgi:hypothetical protein
MNALDGLAGDRLEGVTVTPETGLVTLALWGPAGPRRLAVGLGPRAVGLGLAPRAPAFHAGARHPLAAALAAHAVGRAIRHAARDDDGAVALSFGDEALSARLWLLPARAGEARLTDAGGALVLAWSGDRRGLPRVCAPEGEPGPVGEALLDGSDAIAAESRRHELLQGLRALAKTLGRRRANVEGDLARLDHVPTLQKIGRLLLAQGDRVPRGATRAVLDDWEGGGPLEVALDPARPAKAQAEGFFQRARRVQRGEATMWARLDALTRAEDAALALVTAVSSAEAVTAAALAGWREAARALGLRTPPGAGARGKEAPRLPYAEYLGWRGERVLVGRGGADNDALTRDVAKPGDLWLHARGVAGAHVVVPLARGAQCPPELLLDAATLAAHHSDARGADFVEVTWTERRYVRKPRKSPPGRVVLDRERVLALRPDPARLARLLAARREP